MNPTLEAGEINKPANMTTLFTVNLDKNVCNYVQYMWESQRLVSGERYITANYCTFETVIFTPTINHGHVGNTVLLLRLIIDWRGNGLLRRFLRYNCYFHFTSNST